MYKLSKEDKEWHQQFMNKGKMSSIDMSEYTPIKGMEGPFRFRNGRVLYYDPREGKYYDRGMDLYLSHREGDKLV